MNTHLIVSGISDLVQNVGGSLRAVVINVLDRHRSKRVPTPVALLRSLPD